MKHPSVSIFAAVLACAALSGCGSSGSGAATFDMLFEAPGGSGLAGGSVEGLGFSPLILRDFVLPEAVVVNGQVTDGSGTPISGAGVSFRKSGAGPDIDSDTTDGTGNYTVVVGAGSWVAVVDSGSNALGTLIQSGIGVAAPGPVTVDLQFPSEVSISGTVFESDGATPIPSAVVELTGSKSGANASLVADGSGNYATSLVPDTYTFVVTPAGGAATTHLKQRFAGILVSGATVRDFALTLGVDVSGTVRDNLGLPLLESTDIEVLLSATSDFFPPAPVTASSADGTYSISLVPPGSVTFELEPPGDSGFPRQRFGRQIVGPSHSGVDFTLAAGFVLSGTILQDDGITPEANVDVEPVPTNGSLPPDDDTTDGSGQYEISLFGGTYDIEITPDPANLQLPEALRISISSDTILDITLALGAVLQGTVTEPGGVTAAPDIRVEIPGVLGASDVTDGAGSYSFLAPAGTHTLELTAENGPFEDFALAPETGVAVSLPGPVTHDITIGFAVSGTTVVQGTVFEPDGITVVSGVDVLALDSVTGEVIGRALTDGSGDYLLVIP